MTKRNYVRQKCMVYLRADQVEELNAKDPSITEIPLDCNCRHHNGKEIYRVFYPDRKRNNRQPYFGFRYPSRPHKELDKDPTNEAKQ